MELLGYRMDSPTLYQIRVKGHLDEILASWFDGFTISNREDGDALLRGPIQDQAALHGLLNRISNLGLTLISVNVIPADDERNTRGPDDESDYLGSAGSENI
jgi:hypothetical protein